MDIRNKYDGYKELFRLANTGDQGVKVAKKIFDKIPVESLELRALIDCYDHFKIPDVRALIICLIKKIPVENLDFRLLIYFYKSYYLPNIAVRNFIVELINKIPVDKWDYVTLIDFHKSSCPGVQSFVTELADKIPVKNLDYRVLLEVQKRNSGESLAIRLAQKIPPDYLDFHYLLELAEGGDLRIRSLASILLLKNFASQLDYETLSHFRESSNPRVKNLGKEAFYDISFDQCRSLEKSILTLS